MKLTTLCYIQDDAHVLMLHRNTKDNDENQGKWIGVGGHLEEGESPDECILREISEETDLQVTDLHLRGIITFILPKWGNELTFLYTAKASRDITPICDEGTLKWIPLDEIMELELWEGDRIMLNNLFERSDVFSLKLIYSEDDRLIGYSVD